MSDHLDNLMQEESKKIALQMYDELKLDFQFKDIDLANQIQADLYKVVKEYSEQENLSGKEIGKIIKQFYLNVLAQIANVNLEQDLKEQKEIAQKDLR
jgi:uncharacterized protein YqfB (UPF0267 family)